MYKSRYHKKFVKAVKKCIKRGLDVKLLNDAISILEDNGKLPPELLFIDTGTHSDLF